MRNKVQKKSTRYEMSKLRIFMALLSRNITQTEQEVLVVVQKEERRFQKGACSAERSRVFMLINLDPLAPKKICFSFGW